MKTRTTLSLLAASSLCMAPAWAADATAPSEATRKNYVMQDIETLQRWAETDTLIPFEEKSTRSSPPLSPSLIPGGLDERNALQIHALNQGSTPLVAQNRPFRAVDAYRQYAVRQSGGNAASPGWSEADWEAYGAQFRQSIEGPDGFDPCQRIRFRQFIASGPVRFENEQGRTLFEGYNAFLSNRATLRTGAFLFTVEPELRLHNGARTGHDPRFDARAGGVNPGYGIEDANGVALMEATAQVDVFGAHLTIGRQALVWGPGVHQQLILSANAAPMWMAHLTTSEPLALPGAASKLGYFSPEILFARMDDDRPASHQWLTGMRLGWQVNPYIKFGINLTSTFGSEDSNVTFNDMFFNLTSTNSDQLAGATSDQKCSMDVRFTSPWKSLPFEVYAENGYESRYKWDDILALKKGWKQPAWIAGVHLPALDADGILSATFEYAWTGPQWYVANRYAGVFSGGSTAGKDYAYLYEGRNIGAPMGGNAESFYGELRAKLGAGIEGFASGAFEEHGLGAPVTERLLQTKLGADVDLGRTTGSFKGWHAEGTVAWDHWSNFQGTRGDTQNGVAVGLGLRKGF